MMHPSRLIFIFNSRQGDKVGKLKPGDMRIQVKKHAAYISLRTPSRPCTPNFASHVEASGKFEYCFQVYAKLC